MKDFRKVARCFSELMVLVYALIIAYQWRSGLHGGYVLERCMQPAVRRHWDLTNKDSGAPGHGENPTGEIDADRGRDQHAGFIRFGGAVWPPRRQLLLRCLVR